MTEKKSQLRRQNGMLAGVCGGLGEFFGIRPFWFRATFLALMIPGGVPGSILYIIAWFIMPRR